MDAFYTQDSNGSIVPLVLGKFDL